MYKAKTDRFKTESVILVGGTHFKFNRTNRQDISKNIDLIKVMNKLDLVDRHGMLHPAKMYFVFFKVRKEYLSK